jgi:hypothetical protein
MTELPTNHATPDVPAQVYEKFLEALGEASVSTELISRLQKVLLEDCTFTEEALRAAILGEEPFL